MATKRAVIYARLSVAQDKSADRDALGRLSDSVERQIESCRHTAAARGWEVAGVYVDDGVSATSNRPDQRAGWRELMAQTEPVDAVIVWKIDRLARRVLDFLNVNVALQERGAAIVSATEPIDMTTAQGRAFATMLAVFGEMEADAISLRVAVARQDNLRKGRVVGGTVPYGWRSRKTDDGYVLEQDPERVEYVREMARRVQAGHTIYSVARWLDAEGAPRPAKSRKNRRTDLWHHTTVERILRNPVLAGLTPSNAGNKTGTRGDEVLRGEDGLPLVRAQLAVLPLNDWRALVRQLDDRDSPQTRPRAACTTTSPLLSGLVWCADCDRRMFRAKNEGREGYNCPGCHQTITNFEPLVVEEFLARMGDLPRWSVISEVYDGGAALLPEIEHRLSELAAELQTTDDDDRAEVVASQITALRAQRRKLRGTAPEVQYVSRREDVGFFAEDWAAAGDDPITRRAVLDDALTRITVRRGRPGRRTREQMLARLTFAWKNPAGLPVS